MASVRSAPIPDIAINEVFRNPKRWRDSFVALIEEVVRESESGLE
jgi:hypothetical protein